MSRNLTDLAGVPTEPIPLSVLTGFLGSGGDPCSSAHALSAARLERWPDADRVSRLVFVVRDLEPDEILRRFAAGEPACIAPPAGAL